MPFAGLLSFPLHTHARTGLNLPLHAEANGVQIRAQPYLLEHATTARLSVHMPCISRTLKQSDRKHVCLLDSSYSRHEVNNQKNGKIKIQVSGRVDIRCKPADYWPRLSFLCLAACSSTCISQGKDAFRELCAACLMHVLLNRVRC